MELVTAGECTGKLFRFNQTKRILLLVIWNPAVCGDSTGNNRIEKD